MPQPLAGAKEAASAQESLTLRCPAGASKGGAGTPAPAPQASELLSQSERFIRFPFVLFPSSLSR
ncbi:hypothetical protein GFM02_10295 [Rhizobium leguminosarum bv. viciae]|nr:hypothetical protein [Rhizobium leguminosarum bv. viciae]